MHVIEERRTPRLHLSRPRAADLDHYLRLYADPTVMATLAGVRSRDETAALFDKVLAHWDRHGFGLWLARDLATGAFFGRGGLRQMPVLGRDEVELSYA